MQEVPRPVEVRRSRESTPLSGTQVVLSRLERLSINNFGMHFLGIIQGKYVMDFDRPEYPTPVEQLLKQAARYKITGTDIEFRGVARNTDEGQILYLSFAQKHSIVTFSADIDKP